MTVIVRPLPGITASAWRNLLRCVYVTSCHSVTRNHCQSGSGELVFMLHQGETAEGGYFEVPGLELSRYCINGTHK